MSKLVGILVPVNNEEVALPILFEALDRILHLLLEKIQFHVLVLDDGSEDKTAAIVQAHSSEVYAVLLEILVKNRLFPLVLGAAKVMPTL